ncbi:NAD-dependent epimerase/dehydratase family protein [Chloroflexota bacterium]
MKKALITRRAGFVDSRLAEKLVERSYQIAILDDLSTRKRENTVRLLNNQSTTSVRGSATELKLIKKLVNNADYVFYPAAIPSVPHNIDNHPDSYRVHVDGTLSTYRPRQAPDSQYAAAIPKSIKRVSRENPLIIFGDDEQTRASRLLKMLLRTILRENMKLIHGEPRPEDMRHSLTDITRTRTFTYDPRYDLESGLQ